MADDHRTALYRHLHKQHTGDEAQRIYTANRVLQLVYDKMKVRSVLDVGCGRGLWLAVAGGLGAIETIGIEGPWIKSETSYIALDRILTRDLELGFDLNRTFDLVMSIEVAEHLSPAAAENFVTSLARHGDFILFSAAIPFQPGTGHINCQFPDYWARLFSEHDYQPVDFIRPAIWNDSAMHLWIRQNMLAFVSAQFLSKNSWARKVAAASRPLSIVHPELFTALLRRACLRAGGHNGLSSMSPAGCALIGIGGRLTTPPLPHDRAYGSVHGGWRGWAYTSEIGLVLAGRSGSFAIESDLMSSLPACRASPVGADGDLQLQLEFQPLVAREIHVPTCLSSCSGLQPPFPARPMR